MGGGVWFWLHLERFNYKMKADVTVTLGGANISEIARMSHCFLHFSVFELNVISQWPKNAVRIGGA